MGVAAIDTMAMTSRVLLRTRPSGPVTPDNFLLADMQIQQKLDLDQVLVKVDALTVGQRTYAAINEHRVRLGETVPAYAVGTVVASGSRMFVKGDQVVGFLGCQEYALMYVRELMKLPAGANAIDYLSKYGLEALTAYFALTKYAKLTPGCVVAVSGASGTLGSAAVQIAKHLGAQVLCITSSEAKCRYLQETLKADICVNRTAPNFPAELQAKAVKGIDVLIDTVGGPELSAALPSFNTNGRLLLCGSLQDLGIPRPFVQVT